MRHVDAARVIATDGGDAIALITVTAVFPGRRRPPAPVLTRVRIWAYLFGLMGDRALCPAAAAGVFATLAPVFAKPGAHAQGQ